MIVLAQSIVFSGLDNKIRKDKINACLIWQDGRELFSYYRNRKAPEKLHKVNSVTKSVLSILIGIAVDKGSISLSDPLDAFFDHTGSVDGSITVEHLLMMAPGFEWPEFGSWGGLPFPMINSNNWVEFIFNSRMIETPGTSMQYNSGCSHLLSSILQKATGMDAAEFAGQHLFKPLGVDGYSWHKDSKGIAIGGFGLSLKAEDMLKIGMLMMNEGMGGGKEIVSGRWIGESAIARHHTYDHIGSYAYHWWTMDQEDLPFACYFAMGFAGQYIFVVPELRLTAVFASDMNRGTFKPLNYFKEEILETLCL